MELVLILHSVRFSSEDAEICCTRRQHVGTLIYIFAEFLCRNFGPFFKVNLIRIFRLNFSRLGMQPQLEGGASLRILAAAIFKIKFQNSQALLVTC